MFETYVASVAAYDEEMAHEAQESKRTSDPVSIRKVAAREIRNGPSPGSFDGPSQVASKGGIVVRQKDSPEGAQRAALREAVATVEECLGACEVSPATDSLRSAWAALLAILALGPPPELRACPVCGRNGMRAATRCGYCWTPLAPLDPDASD